MLGDDTIIELTVADLHSMLRQGQTTVKAVVRTYIDRIERYDRAGPELNAVITINQNAIDRARKLDGREKREGEALYGVPILLKDQAKTAGVRTTFGSVAFSEYIPDESAAVVERLEDSGAVIVAKTNLPDFAAGFVGYSSVVGQTRNPYDLSRDSGGSSAGTGAGIAANLGLVGIGEDTGGSIRVPASFCNLFGMRVTTGLISREGFSPLVREQDTAGPMCRTVSDLARVLDAIVGFDPDDEATAAQVGPLPRDRFVDHLDQTALENARIGVLRDVFGSDSSRRVIAVNDVVETALSDIEAAGATLVDPVAIEGIDTLLAETSLYELVAKRDLNDFFDNLTDSPVNSITEIYEQNTYHERLELFETIGKAPADPTPQREYWWRRVRQTELRRRIQSTLAEANLDAIVFPTLQVEPPQAAKYHTGAFRRADVPTNTVIASQSGCPAISIPAGFTTDSLPVGLELLGAPFSDHKLVALATAYEAIAQPRNPPATTI